MIRSRPIINRDKPRTPTTTVICRLCGANLFETDPLLSAEHGSTVWSHVEDTGCDDPTPATATEAVYAALLMLMQRTPRAFAAEGFIRYIEQDGWTVTRAEPRVTPTPATGEWSDDYRRGRVDGLEQARVEAEAREDPCPHCIMEHVWPCPTIPRCDEPGCDNETSCGWPSPTGYHRTCGDHYRAAIYRAALEEPTP